MLGGFVLAMRALDKCRADINGKIGDYHTDCPLDHIFLDYAGIEYAAFRKFVETGADDAAVGKWIEENSKKKGIDVIHFNNEWRYKRIGGLPDGLQEFFETYVPQNVPPEVIHHVRYMFDIFDAEEKRFSR